MQRWDKTRPTPDKNEEPKLKRSIIAKFPILFLMGLFPVPVIEAGESTGHPCQPDGTRVAYADAFDLAAWSERCWEAGDAAYAAALFFLAELRFTTDHRFLDAELEDLDLPDLHQLRNRLMTLSNILNERLFDQPDAIGLALERSMSFEPAMPPVYWPRIALRTNTEDYTKEFHFQYAALNANTQLDIELARTSKWRDIVTELELLLSSEQYLSIDQEERVAALQYRVTELLESSARKVAGRVKANQIQTIIRSYGRYRPEGSPDISMGADTPLGLFLAFDDFIHMESTERIPVRWGESFGLEVDLAGVPIGVPIQLEWSLDHGPLPGDDGRLSKRSSDRYSDQSMDGVLNLSKFLTFVEDVPVACGPWRIELLYEGELLMEQSFFVFGCD